MKSSGSFIGTVQLADEHPMHGRLRPYLVCSRYGRTGRTGCYRVNCQSHHQQELQRYLHGHQLSCNSFIRQFAIFETLEAPQVKNEDPALKKSTANFDSRYAESRAL